jgi:hypothetical protein
VKPTSDVLEQMDRRLRQEAAWRETRYTAFAAARGYRSSTATPCPRVVAGKRCLYPDRECGACGSGQWGIGQQMFDHVRMWLDQGGREVLTTEPYCPGEHDVARFRADMKDLGLIVVVDGWPSPHNPGQTTLIEISRP